MFDCRSSSRTKSLLSRVPCKLSALLRTELKFSSEEKLPKSRQILSPLNLRYRLKTVVVAGVTCFTFVAWMSPVLSQEFREQEIRGEETELEQMYLAQAASADSSAASTEAISTKDVEIPVDELKLLIKPLTLAELEIEAVAWLALVKAKVREISDAEIAIKRKNRQVQQQEEAVKALEEAKGKLEEAEELQKTAKEGSPEYEEAAKKVEEARESLEKAQAAVGEASEAKEKIEGDESVKKAVEAAEEKKEEADAAEEGAEEEEAETDEYDEYYDEYNNEYNETEEPDANEEAAEGVEEAVAGLDEGEGSDGATSAEAVTEQKEQLEEAAEKLEEEAEQEEEIKTQLVVNVTALQQEQTAIVDRFKAVLDELDKKGGSSESYQKYIQAISGIEIDVTDTKGLGVRLLGWFESEEGGQRWAGNIGKFLAIVVVSIAISQLLGWSLNRVMKQLGGSELMRHFLVGLIKRGGVVIGVLVGLTALEVSLGPVLTVLGGASFVLAFALQSNLGNLASGLMIMFYKPFDVGDEVKVAGIWGWVDSISLANTQVKGFMGETISIPNNTVWGGLIENMTGGETRKGVTSVRVPLTEDTAKVEEVLLEIAKSNEFILQENPGPRTSVSDYGDYYVKINLSYTAKTADYWNAWSYMMRAVKPGLEEKGISMAVPLQDIRMQSASNNGSAAMQSPTNGSSSTRSPSDSSTSASLVPAFGDDSEPYEDADDTPYEDK